MSRKAAFLVVMSWLATSAPAAGLEQPGGAPVPSDMGCDSGDPTGLAATFACECTTPGVCNIGDACPGDMDPSDCDDGQNAVCETTLWHEWNDNPCVPTNVSGLDPWTEASVTPETFQPVCPMTFTVVTRGTAIFHDVFGWYNVTGSQPSIDELYVMLECDDDSGDTAVLDVLADPRYTGGEVGFFLATSEDPSNPGTCAGGDCCATLARVAAGEGYIYYSQRSFNPDAAGDDSYIHLLTYDSHISPAKFYFAWEDIFGGSNNDFTDIVTSVGGVECSGGGVLCDTGHSGVCRHGISACRGADLVCVQLYDESGEICDGIDNNCNGQVDEDATCPEGEICQGGRCLPNCDLGEEFQCPVHSVCDHETGRCVDPDCVGVECPEGKICIGGECTGACDDILCPHGQQCREGKCVDPCKHVECGEGEVCREGICFPGCNECNGIVCTDGLSCDVTTSECADPSCPDGCPEGSYCFEGSCVDACDGAVCPSGQICVDGDCCYPDDPSCGDDDPEQETGVDAGPGADDGTPAAAGCGCSSGDGGGGGYGFALLGMMVGWVLTRRRSRA